MKSPTPERYISPPMMEDQYSMLAPSAGNKQPPETSYSFTSRGPTPDGWLPTLCAPGGAVAPVPRHTLQGRAQCASPPGTLLAWLSEVIRMARCERKKQGSPSPSSTSR